MFFHQTNIAQMYTILLLSNTNTGTRLSFKYIYLILVNCIHNMEMALWSSFISLHSFSDCPTAAFANCANCTSTDSGSGKANCTACDSGFTLEDGEGYKACKGSHNNDASVIFFQLPPLEDLLNCHATSALHQYFVVIFLCRIYIGSVMSCL